jgi:hypothetical protein
MLRKYSIFMMLLLATGSLVGISSVYQPTNVETQPGIEGTTQLPREQQQSLNQAMSDTQLLDRLMPLIIKRLDGNMLAQKVLPYLDIKAVVNPRQSQAHQFSAPVDIARDLGLTGQSPPVMSAVRCDTGEVAVGGGFSFFGDPGDDYLAVSAPRGQNEWLSGAYFAEEGSIQAKVTCLTIDVGLKAPQPFNLLNLREKPQPPAQPPGGPPLQPPPNLR